MQVKTRRTWSIILAIMGSVGTITTAYLSRQAAIKELEKRDKIFKEDYAEKLETPKKEVFRQLIPIYIPVAVSSAITVSSIVGSTILSRKNEASLTAFALMADQGWRKYKHSVKETLGLDSHKDILKNVAKNDSKAVKKDVDDDRKLYYEEHVGFFRARPEDIAFSYADINQRLQIEDWGETSYYVMLYNFLMQADAELLNKAIKPEDLCWGWSAEDLMEDYDYIWIHMMFRDDVTENGEKYTIIEWGEEPMLDPGEGGASFANRQTNVEPGPFHAVKQDILEKHKKKGKKQHE